MVIDEMVVWNLGNRSMLRERHDDGVLPCTCQELDSVGEPLHRPVGLHYDQLRSADARLELRSTSEYEHLFFSIIRVAFRFVAKIRGIEVK